MEETKFRMFQNRLQKVYRHLGRQAKTQGITCYRLYDHDLPEFPFIIEIYENHIYLAEYKRRHGMSDSEHKQWMKLSLRVIEETLSVPAENIYFKMRQKKQGRGGQYQKIENRKSEYIVDEGGLKFIINLSDYLDTGLFLDHRLTREMVRRESAGKKVLNLFSYTGSFSVYTAAGGADEVLTGDLSKTYITWAERNMQLNGFTDSSKYKYVQVDVPGYIKTIPSATFDLIILDPPTFSNSKRMENILDIQRDHVLLINECLRILNSGGKIYFSTNYRKFVLDKNKIHSSLIKDITRLTTPFDFEGRLFRYCFLIEK